MKIAICGPSGCGKTTLARALARELEIGMVPEGVREILQKKGWKRPEEMPHWQIHKMQVMLFIRKLAREKSFAAKNKGYVADRSYIDIAAYALAGLSLHPKYQYWLSKFVRICLECAHRYDLHVLLQPNRTTLKDDGVRSPLPARQVMIYNLIVGLCIDLPSRCKVISLPNYGIDTQIELIKEKLQGLSARARVVH